jgi:hypothetical protein
MSAGGADRRIGAEAIRGGGSRGHRPVTGGIPTSTGRPLRDAVAWMTGGCFGVVGDARPLPKQRRLRRRAPRVSRNQYGLGLPPRPAALSPSTETCSASASAASRDQAQTLANSLPSLSRSRSATSSPRSSPQSSERVSASDAVAIGRERRAHTRGRKRPHKPKPRSFGSRAPRPAERCR